MIPIRDNVPARNAALAVWVLIISVGFPLGDYWPFLTSMFLHGGLVHLIGNM